MVGTACWPLVRAAMTVSRCRSVCRASRAITRSMRPARIPRASRKRSTRPVSMMSWLVAPWWANRASSGGSRARRCATSPGTAMPSAAVRAASAAGSGTTRSIAWASAGPTACGITPWAPWARANWASTRMSAPNSASGANRAANSGSANRASDSVTIPYSISAGCAWEGADAGGTGRIQNCVSQSGRRQGPSSCRIRRHMP